MEQDSSRLQMRIKAISGGKLLDRDIRKLVDDGDFKVLKKATKRTQVGVKALLEPQAASGEFEKIVGPTADFLPASYLLLLRRAADAVARVVNNARIAVGTGVMVSPNLFLTNNHVCASRTRASELRLQFDYETDANDERRRVVEARLSPDAFFWTSGEEELDVALIAVENPAHLTEFGWCPMSSAVDKHADGDHVTVVQHPGGDHKQVALRENRVIGRGRGGVTLHYGTDTLPGSSGSPVFNDQCDLLAIHHAGGPKNETVLTSGDPVPSESNEGIRISAVVKALQDVLDNLGPAERPLLAEALNPATSPVQLLAPADRESSRATESGGQDRKVEAGTHWPAMSFVGEAEVQIGGAAVIVPLRLNLSPQTEHTTAGGVATTGAARPASPRASQSLETAVRSAATRPDPDYSSREGYDPGFLAVSVPLPDTGAVADKCFQSPSSDEGPTVLDYHHFSIVMRSDRGLAQFTAVNIDGPSLRRPDRETGKLESATPGAFESAETWYADPRVPSGQQTLQKFYADQRPLLFDRGHLVRRLDPAWGDPADVVDGVNDTFHFTNCCPQLASFNRHLWLRIEDYALSNAKADGERVTVVSGPVLFSDDPKYRGRRVPRRYWKIVVRVVEGELRSTAFLADQGAALKVALAKASHANGAEDFDDLGKVAVFQRSVHEIERLSKLKFPGLAASDTMPTTDARLESNQDLISLEQAVW